MQGITKRKDDFMKRLILVLALALGFAGCQKPADTPTPANVETQTESKADVKTDDKADVNAEKNAVENTISLDDAIKIFNDKHPNVSIEAISFEKELRGDYYEFEGFDETHEYEVKISAVDGSIMGKEAERDHTSDNKAIDLSLLSKIDDLVEAALKDAGSDFVFDTFSIDYEENGSYNKLEIEVQDKVGKDIEYEYNLETGELIKKDM